MAIKKILVRAPNWIGDAVMCLPALASLAELYPSSEIFVLAKPRVVPVFEKNPAVSGIITVEGRRHKGLFGTIRLSWELRDKDFDLAVLFQNAFGAAFISLLGAARERVGYARDLRSGLLTRAIPASGEIMKKHQVFYYLNIIKELGGSVPEKPVPQIHITSEEAAEAAMFLEKNGLAGKPVFGAAPGASYGPSKRWPPERFASVLKGLTDEYGGGALVFGGPEDKEACARVKESMPSAIDLSGKMQLRKSIALISQMSAFVTNDSGPMHLSAALGVPTAAVFGSTEDSLTGPVGRKAASVREKIDCSPCFKRECAFGHYDCLKRVEAGRVLAIAKELMK
ncbi:heptosyltransferase II [uncultured bacterium]|nr:heptosyltransferase II [uncultured bacterium]